MPAQKSQYIHDSRATQTARIDPIIYTGFMTPLAELWKAQQNATFPASCLPLSIDGVRLVKLDAVAGAILTGSFRTDGVARRVDGAKRQELERQSVLITKALREVPLDADGKAYFERLLVLAGEVLSLKE
jgi:hypothetical protein